MCNLRNLKNLRILKFYDDEIWIHEKKEKKEKKSKKDKYHDAQGHFVSKLKSPPRVKTGFEDTNSHSNGLSNGYANGSQTLPNPKKKKEKKRSKSRNRDEDKESRSVSRAESRASRATTASGQIKKLRISTFNSKIHLKCHFLNIFSAKTSYLMFFHSV